MKHLDRAIQPNDNSMDKAYDNAEREAEYLDRLKNTKTPQEIFGEDVFQMPCIYFLKWVVTKNWTYFGGQWWHWDKDLPISDEELYQDYLKSNNP